MQNLQSLKGKLSTAFIEKAFFQWIEEKEKTGKNPVSFTDFLKREADNQVNLFTIWIPVANLEVQMPFMVGNSEIRPISKRAIDSWEKETHLVTTQRKKRKTHASTIG